MKILITGASGMLGTTLSEYLESKGYQIFKSDSKGEGEATKLDITDEENISNVFKDIKPEILINCAAYTNVELAEDEESIANKINGEAVGLLAKHTKLNNIKFFHISTDYVFGDNKVDGYKENDKVGNSLNAYGRSKRLGEILSIENNPNSYICRTSWIFGKNGKNYVDTMLTLAETRNSLNIVDDEFGVPTSTLDISRQLNYLISHIDNYEPGIYHIVNEGNCSRYEESKTIFEIAGKDIKLGKMKLSEYPRKAKIPNYSILLNTKLPKLQNWHASIEEYITNKI